MFTHVFEETLKDAQDKLKEQQELRPRTEEELKDVQEKLQSRLEETQKALEEFQNASFQQIVDAKGEGIRREQDLNDLIKLQSQ